MSGKFITNQEDFLSEVVNDILPSSEKLYFLVGYFYFSGFEEIYKQLKDKEIKILIGMDIEKTVKKKIKESFVFNKDKDSRKNTRNKFYENFVDIYNDTSFFDNKEKIEAFSIFLEKIRNGTLEIKKTLNPNHAKMYLFEKKEEYSEGGRYPGSVITGSSNLSLSGFKTQTEINVIFRDEHFNEGKKIFKKLWRKAVPIADKDTLEVFEKKVIEKIWFNKLYKPFHLYIRILHEYFKVNKDHKYKLPEEITDRYLNLEYQRDAIFEAMSAIKKHGGVLISDVVGLGKSIIGSCVAHNLHLETIIITPPHLEKQWKDYRREFDFQAEIYTSGKLEKALNDYKDFEREKLVIVDEAHKFKNEDTQGYSFLHRLCADSKVMLLTATPFSNQPRDIFSLVSLFQLPAKSTIKTVDNLSAKFRELIKRHKKLKKSQKEGEIDDSTASLKAKRIGDEIRNILFPVLIRRTRKDLKQIKRYKDDLERQNIQFSKVNPPKIMDYDITPIKKLYLKTLNLISKEEKGFIGARYKPVLYLKNNEKYRDKIREAFGDDNLFRQTQTNLASFMKRLLVRRFESSMAAFKKTLDNMINSYESVKKWYKAGRVPIYKEADFPEVGEIIDINEDDWESLKNIDLGYTIEKNEKIKRIKEKGLVFIEKGDLSKNYLDDLNHDIELLEDIKKEWRKIDVDPKAEHFKDILRDKINENPNRKIVVFSEFTDTVNDLYKKLKNTDLNVMNYHSKVSTQKNKRAIIENFDAGIKEKNKKDKYDILIATDAISEGFNLHRAGIVINYDIPYNPTKVIQRVGRINRINKKVFDELYIYNYFPSEIGEEETRTKQISTLKIDLFNALLGSDTKVLTSDEELRSYFTEEYKKAQELEEEESWDTKYRQLLEEFKSNNPNIMRNIEDIPQRVRIRRTEKKNEKGIILFGKKGENCQFKLLKHDESEVKRISVQRAFNLFEAKKSEDPKKVTNSFYNRKDILEDSIKTENFDKVLDKDRRQTLEKINSFISEIEDKYYLEYLESLKYVCKNLDSLSKFMRKLIKSSDEENVSDNIEIIMNQIPPAYLRKLKEKADNIMKAKESIIFYEELR